MAKNDRKIITDRKMTKNNVRHSDAEIDRLGAKTELLIKASKIGTIAIVGAVLLYMIVTFPQYYRATGGVLQAILLTVACAAVCGIGINGILYSLIAKRAEGSFWTAYRQEMLVNMPEEESELIDMTIFREEPGLEYEQMEASVLVNIRYDKLCYTHDTLYGEYGDTCFRMTDLKAGVPQRNEKGRVESRTIFDGVLGMVWNDEAEPLRKNGFLQILSRDYSPETAGHTVDHIIETGDEEFDSTFTVYAQKPNRLNGFFTDDFREILLDIKKDAGCPVAVSFNGGWMFIALNNCPKYFEAEANKKTSQKREEMKSFIRVIDGAGRLFAAGVVSTHL